MTQSPSCVNGKPTDPAAYQAQRLGDGAACQAAALDYRRRGWSALSVCPPDHVGVGKKHGAECGNPGKAPWGDWKVFQTQLPTEDELRRKWRDNPQLNVGMTLGGVTGLIGLDVDESAGEALLERLAAGDLPGTLEFGSGKGRRLLYRVPAGVVLKPTPKPGGLQVEGGELRLLGLGSQTVMPPSRHEKSWRLYAWTPGHGPDEIDPPEAPAWVVELMRDDRHEADGQAAGRNGAAADGERIPEKKRNSTLTSLAGTMRRRGMTHDAIEAALLAENEARCDPPLGEVEVAKIADSVAGYAPNAKASEPVAEEGSPNEAGDDPHRLARLYLAGHTAGGLPTVRFWREEYLRWDGTAYRPLPDKEVQAELCERVKQEFDRLNVEAVKLWEKRGRKDDKGKEVPCPTVRPVTTKKLADTRQALASLCLLPSSVEPPSWLDGEPPFDPAEVLPCRNGLLHLPSLVAHLDCRRPPSPQFFGLNALDYDFDEDALPPAAWIAFLRQLWPTDQQAIATLQEIFGYLLLPDTSQQKVFMLVGPKRSGKGTIARVLTRLVGPANVCNPTLGSLGSNFGLQPLLGKTVAVVSDARLSRRTDAAVVVERLLSISGEDGQTVDRKNLSHVTTRLRTRFVLLTNELPKVTDASGALAGRLVILPLIQSWYGKEDTGLERRLVAELPQILPWAVVGWKRLRDRGHFEQPKSSARLVRDMEDLASPVGAFVRERCVVGAGHEVLVRKLYGMWKEWCLDKGRKPGNEQTFGRDLGAVLPGLGVRQQREGGAVLRKYLGLRERLEDDPDTPQ
jgi:putative DNA primase/helicase